MSFVPRIRVEIGRKYLTVLEQCRKYALSHETARDEETAKTLKIPQPQLNLDRFCDPNLTEYFKNNIAKRKGVGNINRVMELSNELRIKRNELLRRELIQEALNIPNDTHPEPNMYENDAKVLKVIGQVPEYSFEPQSFDKLVDTTDQYRMKGLASFAGHKAYYLIRELAELEQALTRYAIQRLLKEGFSLLSVPDILPHQVIESCGLTTRGKRSLVYRLDAEKHLPTASEGELCLSGTAEMALAGFLMNQTVMEKKLPKLLAAVSRCYRAETADVASEKGLYRVHQFTKVEMFGVATSNKSEELLEKFCSIQEDIFSSFNLHLRVLDMPAHELGAPAYRKYDIEAWLPSRSEFGEVSSCSNCTDYQSRRLNIQYMSQNSNETHFAHTVNGTACAIPRLIMAICETYQQEDGSIKIPKVLQQYMFQKDTIKPVKSPTNFDKRAKEFEKFLNMEK